MGSIVGGYFTGALLSMLDVDYLGFAGKRVSYTYFPLYSTILIFQVLINQRQQMSLSKAKLDDILLEMDRIDLI